MRVPFLLACVAVYIPPLVLTLTEKGTAKLDRTRTCAGYFTNNKDKGFGAQGNTSNGIHEGCNGAATNLMSFYRRRPSQRVLLSGTYQTIGWTTLPKLLKDHEVLPALHRRQQRPTAPTSLRRTASTVAAGDKDHDQRDPSHYERRRCLYTIYCYHLSVLFHYMCITSAARPV